MLKNIIIAALFREASAYEYNLHVEDSLTWKGDEWTVHFEFNHDNDLPIGTAELCSALPPAVADDGEIYLMWRAIYHELSDEVKRVSGMQYVEIDWQPCGHPALANFGKPHYDVHFFYQPMSLTQTRTCELAFPAPTCAFAENQTTVAGSAFYEYGDVQNNMPASFAVDEASAVPQSGIHWYDIEGAPSVAEWTMPVLIIGSYDAKITFFEPMIPIDFVFSGEQTSFESGPIVYLDQTMPNLPTQYDATGETGTVSITFRGAAPACGAACGAGTYCEDEMCVGFCSSGPTDCCEEACESSSTRSCVGSFDPPCLETLWDEQCQQEAQEGCGLKC